MLQDAGVDVNTGKVDLGVLQGKPRSEDLKDAAVHGCSQGSWKEITRFQLMKKPLLQELEKSEKFTEEEARNYIRRMLREASIYESKPGHYNRV